MELHILKTPEIDAADLFKDAGQPFEAAGQDKMGTAGRTVEINSAERIIRPYDIPGRPLNMVGVYMLGLYIRYPFAYGDAALTEAPDLLCFLCAAAGPDMYRSDAEGCYLFNAISC